MAINRVGRGRIELASPCNPALTETRRPVTPTASRRQFLTTAALVSAGLWTRPLGAFTSADLPTPDFSYDVTRPPFFAGLRPYRDQEFRLDAELLGDTFIVHNYGHGGAGITMSWGCAFEVRDYVRAWQATRRSEHPTVAVLGAGVMGLTAAALLVQGGFDVTIYAKGFRGETTSSVAGGQFAPSIVAFPDHGDGLTRFQRILRRSFRQHERQVGRGLGVYYRDNYTWDRSSTFDVVPRDVIPEPEFYERLPFSGHQTSGYCYKTLIIEPPRMLAWLMQDLAECGARFNRRTFSSMDELRSLGADVVINCLGLGARDVCKDSAVVPIKGQIARLRPQPELAYLYAGHGYIFPRDDGVIVGGTYERGIEDPNPDLQTCHELVAYAAAAFDPTRKSIRPKSHWDGF